MSMEWKEVKLASLCKKVTVGHVGSMADKYISSGIPFLRSQNIKPYCIDDKNMMYIDRPFHEKLRKSELKEGDVAIVRTGYPGTACVIPKWLGEANCSDLVIIRPSKELNPYFLTAIFNSSFGKNLVSGNLVGAAQQHFNVTVAKELKLKFPPKPIQNKIAAILTAYDDLIENNKLRIEILETMAEEIYREWFVRFRFPGWEKAEFEKGIPKGWKANSLSEISNILMGQSPKSEFYNENGEGLPFHQGVGTYGSRFPQDKTFCSVEGRLAQKGDILFSVRAPVGRLNIANKKMIIGRGLSAISHKEKYNSYLYYLLKVAFNNEDIIGNGAIFNSVGKDELNSFTLLSPHKKLIVKFNKMAEQMDNQITTLLESMDNLTKTKNLLLPRLISGKLSVEALDIQFPPSMQEDAMV